MTLLDKINLPADLKKLSHEQLILLAKELREFVLGIVSAKEGHLGASLGVVELSIALHRFYNTPHDRIIWDVGHQAYIHKILTGRRDVFSSNRQLGGISGFPKLDESQFDNFGTGHSSTSISALLGMALSSKIKSENRKHIAVIGDASIASGMAFEGLNHAGVADVDITVVLNDNGMGIDPHVGALKDSLNRLKEGHKDHDNIFKALNFEYLGPYDGHDIAELLEAFAQAEKLTGPKLIHIKTVKGKGYRQAEEDQVRFHAPGKFDLGTGYSLNVEKDFPLKFQDVFGLCMLELAEKNRDIIGITPAMPTGSSLKYMMDKFPDRAFDVGIAEQHAVTFAAGMALAGLRPFLTIYSTFLQRAYDQVVHDVALQNIPVVFCIDRGGIVGEDGPTHHGVFDIAWLRSIPNMVVCAPMVESELRSLMHLAVDCKSPISIRYPRGRGVELSWPESVDNLQIGRAKLLQKGNSLAILSFGSIGVEVKKAIDLLDESSRSSITFYNMLFAKPIDESALFDAFNNHQHVICAEDGVVAGGFASAVLEWANQHAYKQTVDAIGIQDKFVEHGKVSELYAENNMDYKSIARRIAEILTRTKKL